MPSDNSLRQDSNNIESLFNPNYKLASAWANASDNRPEKSAILHTSSTSQVPDLNRIEFSAPTVISLSIASIDGGPRYEGPVLDEAVAVLKAPTMVDKLLCKSVIFAAKAR